MQALIIYAIPFFSFLILDGIWFKLFMTRFAELQLQPILNWEGEKMNVRTPWAIIAYMLMVLIATTFLYPAVQNAPSSSDAMWLGFVMGVCVFGIFDCTNAALMKVYPASFVFIDTLWGGFLYTSVAVFYKLFVIEIIH